MKLIFEKVKKRKKKQLCALKVVEGGRVAGKSRGGGKRVVGKGQKGERGELKRVFMR